MELRGLHVAGHDGQVVCWKWSCHVRGQCGDISKVFVCVDASRRMCRSQSLLSDFESVPWFGGGAICIGIWSAKRYRHMGKGGWGNWNTVTSRQESWYRDCQG